MIILKVKVLVTLIEKICRKNCSVRQTLTKALFSKTGICLQTSNKLQNFWNFHQPDNILLITQFFKIKEKLGCKKAIFCFSFDETLSPFILYNKQHVCICVNARSRREYKMHKPNPYLRTLLKDFSVRLDNIIM